jgi:hypothetical protein
MNSGEYSELLARVSSLDPAVQMRLVEDLSSLTRQRTSPPRQNDKGIMELEGLGREIWQNRDAQEYVHQERDSWNG